MKIMANMITVAIQPFALKKVFLLIAAIICLTSAACLADPLFMNARSTSMSERRNVDCGFSQQSKTSDELESSTPSGCGPEASALYNLIDVQGAANVRLASGAPVAPSAA
jgi:hypothetical protein